METGAAGGYGRSAGRGRRDALPARLSVSPSVRSSPGPLSVRLSDGPAGSAGPIPTSPARPAWPRRGPAVAGPPRWGPAPPGKPRRRPRGSGRELPAPPGSAGERGRRAPAASLLIPRSPASPPAGPSAAHAGGRAAPRRAAVPPPSSFPFLSTSLRAPPAAAAGGRARPDPASSRSRPPALTGRRAVKRRRAGPGRGGGGSECPCRGPGHGGAAAGRGGGEAAAAAAAGEGRGGRGEVGGGGFFLLRRGERRLPSASSWRWQRQPGQSAAAPRCSMGNTPGGPAGARARRAGGAARRSGERREGNRGRASRWGWGRGRGGRGRGYARVRRLASPWEARRSAALRRAGPEGRWGGFGAARPRARGMALPEGLGVPPHRCRSGGFISGRGSRYPGGGRRKPRSPHPLVPVPLSRRNLSGVRRGPPGAEGRGRPQASGVPAEVGAVGVLGPPNPSGSPEMSFLRCDRRDRDVLHDPARQTTWRTAGGQIFLKPALHLGTALYPNCAFTALAVPWSLLHLSTPVSFRGYQHFHVSLNKSLSPSSALKHVLNQIALCHLLIIKHVLKCSAGLKPKSA